VGNKHGEESEFVEQGVKEARANELAITISSVGNHFHSKELPKDLFGLK
jgi:hypothetical protein